MYLLQGNDIREHWAVEDELHLLVLVGFGGVLPDDGEKKGLVSQIFSPKREGFQSCSLSQQATTLAR